LWNKNTPQVFYKISATNGGFFLSRALYGNYAIDIDTAEGSTF
jgi:hypothetical protein